MVVAGDMFFDDINQHIEPLVRTLLSAHTGPDFSLSVKGM